MPRSTYQRSRSSHQYSYHVRRLGRAARRTPAPSARTRGCGRRSSAGVISLRKLLAHLGDAERRLLAASSAARWRSSRTCPGPSPAAGRRRPPSSSTGPAWVLNIRLNCAGLGEAVLRAAVRAARRGRRACRGGSAPCSSLQSTSGSVKLARWPLTPPRSPAAPRMAASRPTTSSRSCTIERHQASFTLRSSSTPSGPVVVGGPEAAVDLGRREHEAPALAEVDDLVELAGGHGRQG